MRRCPCARELCSDGSSLQWKLNHCHTGGPQHQATGEDPAGLPGDKSHPPPRL
ncbi:hypothetical protein mRhiFer1_006151 [Rhinolophus ferrumequinum]|uniref:Uncharacterized protein n=1 Tax=Rhinolophus ferrumequinum TaxID=59479 RepID=A0A7J7XNY2_RHIFE|nr:hypothetical protein mRhiFer1_006151 [Rhinolophus ferrumequinum]